MTWPRWAPSTRSLLLAAVLVPAALVIVGVVRWFTDTDTARMAYLGMVFMAVGVLTLSRSRQLLLAAAGGLAAGLGALVAQHTVLLVGAVAVACLAQWPFNRRSTQVAALLPYLVVLYAATAPPEPLRVVGATWLGALALMGLGALIRLRVPAQPTTAPAAARHAVALAIGCVALVLVGAVVDAPKGLWAVLTLCLVFMPASDQTVSHVRERVLGTVAGVLAADVIALIAPMEVRLVVVIGCAFLNVAYTLAGRYSLAVAFLTPAVLLPYGLTQLDAVLTLSVQRVAMTLVAGALALLLTALITRWGEVPGPDSGRVP